MTSAYTCAGERSSMRNLLWAIFTVFALGAPRIIQIVPQRVGTHRMAHDIRDLADEEVMQLVQTRRPARLRAALRPPRRRGVLARLPDGRQAGDRGGRGAGGVPLDLAQPPALRPDARQRAHLGARHRPQPRRSTRCGAARSTTAGARRSRGSRSASRRASGRTSRWPGARRRAACAARWRRCPTSSGRTIELAYFGGFTHTQIAELLRRADRHGEGPDAARPREDEARSCVGGVA